MLKITVIIIFGSIHHVDGKSGMSTRLLVDDPQYVANQLHQMQVQLQSQKAEIQDLKTRLSKSELVMSSHSGQADGATYIRWGRKTCETNQTELVYSGFAAGGNHLSSGSAADYLCLPPDPNLGGSLSGDLYGSLYGAEYESDAFGSGLWNNDVPCAVCRSTSATSVLMIPGKNHCYDGWFTEYVGQLAGGYHGHAAASLFVCLDMNPDVLLGGETSQDGKLFYPIKTVCGSLKCPPYHNDRVLPCVVCTK